MSKKITKDVEDKINLLKLKIEYARALRANMVEHSANHRTRARVLECRENWKAIRKAEQDEKHDYSQFKSIACDIKNAIELQKTSTIERMLSELNTLTK